MQDSDIQARDSSNNPEHGKKNKPFQLIAFSFRRAPLVLFAGGIICFLLFLLLLPRVSPIYETQSMLLVDPAKETTLAGRERDPIPGDIGKYTRNLIERIPRYDVLATAISRLDEADYPVFLNPGRPEEANVYSLMSRIRVREVHLTYLISLTISAEEPQGLAPVLNEVMKAFLEKMEHEQEGQYVRRINYLSVEKERISARLEDARTDLQRLVDSMDSKSFLQDNYTSHIYKKDMLQRMYLEAEEELSRRESLLDQAIANREAIPVLDLQAFADERVADNFGINRIEQWTYEQLQALRASIDGLTPENPDRIYVEQRMEAMEAFLEQYKQRVNKETIRNIRERQKYELNLDVIQARTSYDASVKNTRRLKELLEQATREASQVSEAIYQASAIQFRIEQLRERLTALNNRMDDAEMVAKSPIPVDIDKLAVTPGVPARTNIKVISMMILALGFGSVFSFVLVFDFMDNRLRDPGEVEQALGGSGPAPIPYMSGRDLPPGSFFDASLELPEHSSVLAIRSLAVRMELEKEKNDARVFAIAGLNPECGVTSLALNLAHILRAGSDKILVLECNLLRPGAARVESGLSKGPGLWEILQSSQLSGWQEVVQVEPRRAVHVMTAGDPGPGIPNRSAMLNLLDNVRREYDLVILDLSTIIDDEFAYFAAVHSDAVLLVGREDVSQYRDLRRSIEMLVDARVPAVSAILNFSRPRRVENVRNVLQKQMQFVSRVHRSMHRMVRRSLRLNR
ncbi:GumC family protein [Desulfonatronovibrio magnus]|uniref:GumC family protein n=1 Tax=Desulfonatronovibrio magnus TaxID=698827 RepID=UPI0005EBA50B|nr:hypothetical protein [Desulfonatronovibrio magnus]